MSRNRNNNSKYHKDTDEVKGKPQTSNSAKNRSNAGNRGKSYSKGRNNRDDRSPGRKVVDAINDISWYAHNPQLLRDSSSLPFNQMLGLPMSFGAWNATSGQVTEKLPGLMLLDVVPAFGASTPGSIIEAATPESAINIAAQNIYSYIRHANSGHANYDPTDLMMYIVAMDQAYSFHAYMVRAYGLMRFYSGYNRYLGKYLVDALGFDYDSLINNLAQFRYIINNFAARLCTFAVPAVFPIFERHRWIYSNVYMDRPSTRAQLYAFNPMYFGVYNEPVRASGIEYRGAIKAESVPSVRWNIDRLRIMTDRIINPILHSEDIGIISGDILKAYGPEKCYLVNALPEEYVLGPVYVEEVLKQIHNSVTIGTPAFHYNSVEDQTPLMVYQQGDSPIIGTWHSSNCVVNVLTRFTGGGDPSDDNLVNANIIMNPVLLDTNTEGPTPEEVMIMTRLTNKPTFTSGAHYTNELIMDDDDAYGQAIITVAWYQSITADAVIRFRVFSGELGPSNLPAWTAMYTYNVVTDDRADYAYNETRYRKAKADISTFNWHPIIYEYGVLYDAIKTGGTPILAEDIDLRIIADIDNCVPVSAANINRIHDVAILSLLNVPSAVVTKGI